MNSPSPMIAFASPLPAVAARAPGASHPEWTRRCFAVAMLMAWDEELWRDGRLDPERVLDRLRRDYGGIDLLLLWNTYNGGVDDRADFDFWRDLPGLEDFCARLRARGIRLMMPYKHWDVSTRDGGGDHARELADLVRRTGSDAVFLDCGAFPPEGIRAAVEAVNPEVVWCSEDVSPEDRLETNAMSWFHGQGDDERPGLPRLRWLDRRHRQIEAHRSVVDQTVQIQRAWLSGNAFLIWENVFGYWAPLEPRCRSLLRAMLPAQRRFAGLIIDGEWTPWVACAAPRLHASGFSAAGQRLWTVVNRSADVHGGLALEVPHRPGELWFDVISGRRLEPRIVDGRAQVELVIRGRGLAGALAAAPAALGAGFEAFLAEQAASAAAADWSSPPRTRANVKTGLPHQALIPAPIPPHAAVPERMVRIGPWQGEQIVTYRMREIGFLDGDPAHLHPHDALHHPCQLSRQARIGAVAIDRDLVSNREFAAFLAASGWRPRDEGNFLRHWRDGRPPAGAEDQPVAWVNLDDARAYARWAGKRLPSDAEWQRTGQGPSWHQPSYWPEVPSDYLSPEGVVRLLGHLWQWTGSEHSDGHTRYCLIRGGSSLRFRKEASDWYFESGAQTLDRACKLVLSSPAADRFATVGFRCAVDLEE